MHKLAAVALAAIIGVVGVSFANYAAGRLRYGY